MAEPNADYERLWGDGWEPEPGVLKVVTDYLIRQPEQGDWPWEDHCEGVAGGILWALHTNGMHVQIDRSGAAG